MPEAIHEVKIPQLGVNDDSAILVDWAVPDRESVKTGDLICTVETTKAAFDVEAEATGVLVHLAQVGEEVNLSAAVGLIGDELESLLKAREQRAKKTGDDASVPANATHKARQLADSLGVDLKEIRSEGIIREEDVRRHHAAAGAVAHDPSSLRWKEDCKPVMIYGAGRGGVTVKECLDLMPGLEAVAFLDDRAEPGARVEDLPVLSGTDFERLAEHGIVAGFCAIADANLRLSFLKRCERAGVEAVNAVHPEAHIASSAVLGRGNHIKSGAVIETNTSIGSACIIDNGTVIAHDCVIEDACHLAPGVTLGSSIRVGARSVIGIGASISTGLSVGASSIVTVGSAVTKDVPDHTVVEGVPARIIGKRRTS